MATMNENSKKTMQNAFDTPPEKFKDVTCYSEEQQLDQNIRNLQPLQKAFFFVGGVAGDLWLQRSSRWLS